MGRIPIGEVRKVLAARKDAARRGGGVVRLSVMVSLGAPPELVRAVRAGLRPMRAGGRLHVEGFSDEGPRPQVNSLSDAAVVLCSPASAELGAQLWRSFAQAGVPCALVGLVEDAGRAADFRAACAQEGVDEGCVVLGSRAEEACEALGAWLVDALDEERADAAASNFACCRAALARGLVREACASNALVALLAFVPGADLPAMCVTQLTLALRLAALYGQPLDAGRLGELTGVVAGAFGLRGVARLAARRLSLPALLTRVGVGAGGTYAMGMALVRYFEGIAAGAYEDTTSGKDGR